MKLEKCHIRAAVIIFLIAFAFRLIFIYSSPGFAAQGDSKYYIGPAYQLSHSLNSWTDFKEAINRMTWRGPVYPFFLAFLIKAGQTKLDGARLAQAFLNALTCVLLYFLALRFGSRKTGWIAGILAALYTPFLFASTAILQGCLTAFLLTLTMLLIIRAGEKPSPGRFLIGGISLALLMLSRAVMLYLPIFLALPVGLLIWKSKKKLGNGLAFAGGLIGPLIGWFIILTVIPPTYSASKVAGFSNYPWILNFLRSDGWTPDAASAVQFTPHDPRLGGEVFTDKSPSGGERFLYLARGVRLYPRLVVSIFIKNLYRLWFYPYMVYWPAFILTDGQLYLFHQAIILLALIGLPLSFASGRIALLPLAFLIHGSVIFAIVNVEARYNIPFMPVAVLLAAVAIDSLTSALGKARCLGKKLPFILAGGVALFFTALAWIFTLPVILRFFPETKVMLARWVRIELLNLWIVLLALILYKLVRLQRNKKFALITSVFFLVVVLGIVDFNAYLDKRWGKWTARLAGPSQRIRQEITLPFNFDLAPYQEAALLIDMQRRPGWEFPVLVEVDGRISFARFKSRKNNLDRKLTGKRGRLPQNVRQWVEVPIDLSLLKDRSLIVDIHFEDPGMDGENYLDVWGDYRLSRTPKYYDGPALPSTNRPEFLSSLPKLMEDWDQRLDGRTPLGGGLAAGRWIGEGRSYADLSPERGMQTGAYRIRLRLSKPHAPPYLDPLTQKPVVEYIYF